MDLNLVMIGAIIVIIGIAIIMLAVFSSLKGRGKTEVGGVILIGPIPIIFGSSKKFLLIGVIGALVIAISVIASFLV
ncbi:MAG: DUF131 domain-containing protein [Promethearchaeota archaeon]